MWGEDVLSMVDSRLSADGCVRVGLRLALRIGKFVQGKMMARHKVYAQGLTPSDIPLWSHAVAVEGGYNKLPCIPPVTFSAVLEA